MLSIIRDITCIKGYGKPGIITNCTLDHLSELYVLFSLLFHLFSHSFLIGGGAQVLASTT